MATEHTYEVWSTTAVGRMRSLTTTDEREAVAKLDYLHRAQAANGFGGTAWITRDGDPYEVSA